MRSRSVRESPSAPVRSLLGGVVVVVWVAALVAVPSVALAGPTNPTVSSFSASPTSLTASGGSVNLSAQVTNLTFRTSR
jgi:hypothetical protein